MGATFARVQDSAEARWLLELANIMHRFETDEQQRQRQGGGSSRRWWMPPAWVSGGEGSSPGRRSSDEALQRADVVVMIGGRRYVSLETIDTGWRDKVMRREEQEGMQQELGRLRRAVDEIRASLREVATAVSASR